jgi:general secretion pathway protein D
VERTGLLIPYQETNTIIVIDTQSNINRLVRIITELDVPGDEEIWVVSLKHAKADELAKKLLAVLQEKRVAGGPAKQELKIMADERTNSLVVLATPPQMARVRMLVEKLDQSLVRSRENIHIYSLQNAVAENLAKVLLEIPGKGTKDEKVKAPPISKDVQITADKATNSLVIIAEPEEYAILVEVIKKLDEPRAMVYVEALIMEVSATKAMDLGVEWRLGNEFDGGFGAGQPGGVWFTGARGDLDVQTRLFNRHPSRGFCGRRDRQGHYPGEYHFSHDRSLCEGGENGQ